MRYLGRPRSREEVEAFHHRQLAAGTTVAGLGFWVGFVDGCSSAGGFWNHHSGRIRARSTAS
jgi:hypothetical protein